MMESTYDEIQNIKEDTICHVVMLTVAFDQDQNSEFCPYKAKVGKYDLFEASKEILRQIIKELCHFEKYIIEVNGETKEVYSTAKAIECNDDAIIVSHCSNSIYEMIRPEPQQIFQQDLGTASLVGSSIKLKFQDCITVDEIEFDYCKEYCTTDGIVICECETI